MDQTLIIGRTWISHFSDQAPVEQLLTFVEKEQYEQSCQLLNPGKNSECVNKGIWIPSIENLWNMEQGDQVLEQQAQAMTLIKKLARLGQTNPSNKIDVRMWCYLFFCTCLRSLETKKMLLSGYGTMQNYFTIPGYRCQITIQSCHLITDRFCVTLL